MQVGSDFGIVVDSFETILAEQLNQIQENFSDAVNIDSPAYALAYLQAKGISVLQQGLQVVWNSINADTAQGLGLDILANNLYNSLRLIKKSYIFAWVNITVPANSEGFLGLTTKLPLGNLTNAPIYLLASSYSKKNDSNLAQVYAVRLTFVSTNLTYFVNENKASGDFILNSDTTNITSVTIDTTQTVYSTASVLGSVENDEAFQLRRKAYLNNYGQPSQGLQKAISDLNIPALRAVYVQEYIAATTRGFVIFIDYPTIIPNPPPGSNNNFDTADANLQLIAQTAYNFKPFGITSLGFNGSSIGDTLFRVTRNFTDNLTPDVTQAYVGKIYLNPMQYTTATLTLTLWVTLKALDTSSDAQPFPSVKNDQALMKNELIVLINEYFLSKYRVNNNVFSIGEIMALIQKNYTGILGFLDTYFLDTSQIPPVQIAYVERVPGIIFQLTNASFTFTLKTK